MTRYGMVIDRFRCTACGNCVMACRSENATPSEVLWNRPITEGDMSSGYLFVPAGTYPNDLHMTTYTLGCQHCSNPACVEVCPTGASEQREDGIVVVDEEKCIGCDACMAACPYDVRTHISNPKYILDFQTGDYAAKRHVDNTVEKCTFCAHRIDRGERPACADICRYGARFFGDLDDPTSDVSKILQEKEYSRLLEEYGTEPNVYFIN